MTKRRIVKTVRDLENRPDIQLVSIDYEVWQILQSLGLPSDSYGCLFIDIKEGDFVEIWGCESNIPYNDYELTKLK